MAFSYLNDSPNELAKVLNQDIAWESFLSSRMISDKDLQLIRRYDKRSSELRASMLDEVDTIGNHMECNNRYQTCITEVP